ncbi:breast cancer type 1 susceptibility protein homolog [Ceratina calcarata]|uniref:Breast cancer type 1 susceptibility protein homolog n=1 Tax=Ceratina calcarata TaxID=156304 RepID=A0AAJ7J8F9_9HYME|nr:breast cancer type 1 susceptibility protein homolog [Ceratina calcarata]
MSCLGRSYNTREVEPPKIYSNEGIPSCSYINSSLEKGQLKLRSNQQDRSRNVPKEKRKIGQDDSIKKYLSNRGVSGAELFVSEKSTDYCRSETSTEEKVQTWLKCLPDTEDLYVNRDTPILVTADNSVNPLRISVSQNLGDNKAKSFDMDDIETLIVDKRSLNDQERDRNESCDEGSGKPEIGAFTKYLLETYHFEAGSPKPGPSGIKKSHDDAKEKKQEVHRTSLKDNWTSVVQLGKKMRTKKKKFKALNVSIEKARSRSLNDTRKKETAKSLEKNDRKSERRQNRSDSFECKPMIIVPEKERSLKEQTVVQKESPIKSEDISIEGNEQHNASFITLEGERVHIGNLNNNQMTDIIGIAPSDKQFALNSSSDTIIIDSGNQIPSNEVYNERTTLSPSMLDETLFAQIPLSEQLSLKKSAKTKLSESFTRGSVESQLQTVKSDFSRQIDQNEVNTNAKERSVETKLSESPATSIDSHLQTVKSDFSRQIDQNEGNTNAKKRSINTKLSESPTANVDSRLQTVKSDLIQIDQNKGNANATESVDRIIEGKCSLEVGKESRGLFTNPVTSPKALTRNNKKQNRPVVTFKKLGKTFKQYKKSIRFLYLGSTRRKAIIPCIYGIEKVRKNCVCDNVETVQLETEMCVVPVNSVKGFGKSISVTVNNTPIDEEVENITDIKEMKNEQSKESDKNTKPCMSKEISNVPGRSQDSNVLLISLDVNEETKEAQETTSLTRVRMFSPMDDSQLQFLSLGSPMNEYDNVKTNNSYNPSETPKKSKIQTEEECVCSSNSSSVRPKLSSHRKRKRVNSRETSPELSKPSEQAMSTFRNKISAMKDNSDNSALIGGKKQYRRILPLASDSGSPSGVPKLLNNQSSSSNKRKRAVLSDSDDEMDLSVIENWCTSVPNDKYIGKCEVSDSAKASNEAKDKSFSTNCNKNSSKLSSLPQKLADFADNRSNQKCNSSESQGKKKIVLDEDSPDFGSTIDKVKDIKNKGVVSKENTNQCFMQDTFDEAFANVNTADLIVDEEMYEEINKKNESVCKKRKPSITRSNENSNSDKENDFMMSTGRIKIAKNSTIEENVDPVASTSKTSIKIHANDSANQNLSGPNEIVKDSFENDSFVNVTEDYLMLQQFEEDLLGKSLSSKLTFGWQLGTPQKLKRNQKSSTNQKDVEHEVEDDDGEIIENTPDAKKKNMQLANSQQEIVMSTPKTILLRFSNSPSTAGKSSSNFTTPPSTRIQPLCQSTPKTPQSTNSTSFLRRLTFKAIRDTDKSTKNAVNVENNPSGKRQGLCFTCSGLMASQIENVERLARTVNARYVSQFEREVTHVVVMTDENNGANKTLKYLQGIANRKWIVSYRWVIDSIKAKRLMDEEQYEVVDCRTLEAGPRRSRLRDTDLFKQFVFLCVGPYTDISVKQYQDLLRATGASVVESLNALVTETKLKIIVVQADTYEHEIIKWYKETKAISIDHEWIFECISQYKLISLYPYLQELSRPDALALGFPECLLQEDPDCDSASTNDDVTCFGRT